MSRKTSIVTGSNPIVGEKLTFPNLRLPELVMVGGLMMISVEARPHPVRTSALYTRRWCMFVCKMLSCNSSA